jgi:hypothetical protein
MQTVYFVKRHMTIAKWVALVQNELNLDGPIKYDCHLTQHLKALPDTNVRHLTQHLKALPDTNMHF